MNSVKLQDTKSTHKNQLYFYILTTISKGYQENPTYSSIKNILRDKLFVISFIEV